MRFAVVANQLGARLLTNDIDLPTVEARLRRVEIQRTGGQLNRLAAYLVNQVALFTNGPNVSAPPVVYGLENKERAIGTPVSAGDIIAGMPALQESPVTGAIRGDFSQKVPVR